MLYTTSRIPPILAAIMVLPALAAETGLIRDSAVSTPYFARDSVKGRSVTVRSRWVDIDTARLVAALERSTDTGVAAYLDLFADVSIPVAVGYTESHGDGGVSYVPRLLDDPQGLAVLTVTNGRVQGVIQHVSGTYVISSRDGGGHVLRQIDPDAIPLDVAPTHHGVTKAVPQAETGFASSADAAVIRVGILATTLVSQHYPGGRWQDIARNAIASANAALKASGAHVRFQLADLKRLDYDETGQTYETMLGTVPMLAEVKAWRNEVRADLVSIFRDNTGEGHTYCGMGWAPTQPGTYSRENEFSTVINTTCAAWGYVLGHELGHNLGLLHDRYTENDLGILQDRYNYGYVNIKNPDNAVRTLMAYGTLCADKGVSCRYLLQYSNPKLWDGDARLGVKPGGNNPADATLRINETAPIVAGYR